MKNPFTRIRDYFSPPKLRNKPGGLAFIRNITDLGDGASAMNGRIVRTVRVTDRVFWEIDPPQPYAYTGGFFVLFPARATCIAINDRCLVPMDEPGDDAQDESLRYLPPVPTPTRTPETV